jgi:hypothetical protein
MPSLEVGQKAPPPPLEWETGEVDVADIVFLAYMHTDEDALRAGDTLFNSGKQEYEQRIREELVRLGCTDEGVYLSDPGEVEWLHSHCLEVGRQVTATFNTRLRRAIDVIIEEWREERGSLKGLNRVVMAKLVREWIERYDAEHGMVIVITESGVVDDRAILRFALKNSTGGFARVVPEAAVCDVCKAYVAMGWVWLSQARRLFSLPAHPGCPHTLEIDLRNGVPPCEQMWRGGETGGPSGPEAGQEFLDELWQNAGQAEAGGKEAGPGRGWWGPAHGGTHAPRGQAEGGLAPAGHESFAKSLSAGVREEHRPFVTMYSGGELKGMGSRPYLSKSGKTGFAIKPDGEIISVFSTEGMGRAAMTQAIKAGGTKIEAFDGFLTKQFYPMFGFKETGRMAWDNQYAPKGWNHEKFDHPSVVMMSLGG